MQLEGFGSRGGLTAFAADWVMDQISGDTTKPRAKLGRFAQMAQLLPGGQKSLLRDVLTLAQAPGGAIGDRADERLVSGDDHSESITAPGEASSDKFSVVVHSLNHRIR